MVVETKFYHDVNRTVKKQRSTAEKLSILHLDWPRSEQVIKNICFYATELGLDDSEYNVRNFSKAVVVPALNSYAKKVFTFNLRSIFSTTDINNEEDNALRLAVFISSLITFFISFGINAHLFFDIKDNESVSQLRKQVYDKIIPEQLRLILEENNYEKTMVYNHNNFIS